AAERLDLHLQAELAQLEIDCPASPPEVSGRALALANHARASGFYRTFFEAELLAARCSVLGSDSAKAKSIARSTRMAANRTGWGLFAREAGALESAAAEALASSRGLSPASDGPPHR